MKTSFYVLLLQIISVGLMGCATMGSLGGPSKQDAEAAWNSIDTTSSGWETVYPRQASCYDKAGKSIDSQNCDDIQAFQQKIADYRRAIEIQPTECAFDEYMTAQEKVNFAKFCQEARQKRVKRSDELKATIKQKESLLRDLVPKSTEVSIGFIQKVQNKENTQIAELDKVISSKGLSAEALARDKKRQEFVKSSSSKYGLSKAEFQFEVIRGDWVDDWGLTLGETVYELEQSPKTKISKYGTSSQGENKVFDLTLKAAGQQILVKFILLKDNKYALLDSVKVGSEVYSGHRAELILGQLLNK